MEVRYRQGTERPVRECPVTESPVTVRPEGTDSFSLVRRFSRLGKLSRREGGGYRIELEPDEAGDSDNNFCSRYSAARMRETAKVIVRSLYYGAYRFRKEAMQELFGKPIYPYREMLADYGEAVFELVCDVDLRETLQQAEEEARCIGYARSLGNLPANYLDAAGFMDYAASVAGLLGSKYELLGEKELKSLGCGGILAVNQGSDKEAGMAVLCYEGEKGQPFTALVGKGVMFDSGGYHLKSIDGMEGMKYDMCGAAGMLEAFEILAKRKGKKNVIAVLPLVENMIGPKAVRMGDVITMMDGKTVEIYNTDAEGRLILADAIWYAQKKGAKRLIDLATLTYSCQEALGDQVTGVFSNDSDFCGQLMEAAEGVGEALWRLPLSSDYREKLHWPDCADLANYAPGKRAGASMAASFLEEFIQEGTRWIHLDEVGPAVAREESEYGAKGATGANIAAIVRLIDSE